MAKSDAIFVEQDEREKRARSLSFFPDGRRVIRLRFVQVAEFIAVEEGGRDRYQQFRIDAILWYGRDKERALEAESAEGKVADEIDSKEQVSSEGVGAGGGSAISKSGG